MQKLWMVIFAIIALAWFGGFATEASAKTLTEVAACTNAGLAAEPFKGSSTARLAQARRLPVGTQVLVGGTKMALADGESLWKKCEGPSALELANLRISDLETANASLNSDNATLQGKLKTTEASLATVTSERDQAIAAAKSAGIWNWILGVLALFAAVAGMVLWRKFSGSDAQLQKLLARQRQAADQPTAPAAPQGDADLEAPATPSEDQIPDFLKRTRPQGEFAPEAPEPAPQPQPQTKPAAQPRSSRSSAPAGAE